MTYAIHYLQWPQDEEARELFLDLHGIGEDAGSVSESEFERLYDHIGTDEAAEDLEEVFARWNHGSGRECETLLTVWCTDCDVEFTSDTEASRHAAEENHTIDGHRSLSVGDIVVEDEETGYVCASMGWRELPHLGGGA